MRLAVVFVLLLAAPAHATTVSGGNPLVITAAAGEINTVKVQDTPTGITITDSTSDLSTSADGCTESAPRTVSCEGTYGVITADLRDRNDQLAVSGTFLTLELDGGGDNDSLDTTLAAPFASDARFTLSGNDGDDELRGGAYGEVFSGGEGSDAMHGAGGLDQADYSDHADDIVVNLSREGGQGALGEGDLLTSIESVVGGLGDDVLVGDETANVIYGYEGRDRIRGGAGPDDLQGDRDVFEDDTPLGDDHVRGGAGDDRIHVQSGSIAEGEKGDDSLGGSQSRFLCGAGEDTVGPSLLTGYISRSCERIAPFVFDALVLGPLRRSGKALTIAAACGNLRSFCDGRIRVHQDGVIAGAPLRLEPGETRTIRMRLRRAPKPRRFEVVLGGIGPYTPITWETRL
jgi:Ca2+-binding RTX toxin-like protein